MGNPTLEFLRELHALNTAKDEDYQRIRINYETAQNSVYNRYRFALNELAEKYGVPVELIR